MKISQQTFKQLLLSEQVPFWTAATIVGRSYCGLMTTRGLCPAECTQSQQKLQQALELSAARNPSALLTRKLRDLIAKNQEEPQAEEHAAPSKNELGIEFDGNPFEAILNEAATAKS